MTTITHTHDERAHAHETTSVWLRKEQVAGETLQALGEVLMRYGLVIVLAWIGAMKFTAYEAHGIQPLVANSPLLSWVYAFLSVQAFSNVLGIVEIAVAVMIALRPVSARVAALGSSIAARHVSYDSEFFVFNTRLGVELRRLSCVVRRSRAIRP